MFTFPVGQVQCQNHLPELTFQNFLPAPGRQAGLNVEPCPVINKMNVPLYFHSNVR